MDNQFLRTQMLLGGDAMNQLHRSHVAVFGLGGVGSYAVEALVRSGVGELTLIDDDTVSPTNLNRQLEALHSTVGQNKTDALAARCRDINPDVRLHLICARYDAAHREDFFTARYDYILDAIDTVSSKLDLIQTAQARGIPILSAMGTGNKLDASQLCITDISKTRNCSLARVMRKELRERGVKHRVGYLICEFVWVSLRHRLRRNKKPFFAHVQTPPCNLCNSAYCSIIYYFCLTTASTRTSRCSRRRRR